MDRRVPNLNLGILRLQSVWMWKCAVSSGGGVPTFHGESGSISRIYRIIHLPWWSRQ